MAPAALDTVHRFLESTQTTPGDYDMILTGDLGAIGSALLLELAQKEHGLHLNGIHRDCGMLLYHAGEQDVGMGASGAGCSAAVVCAEILPALQAGLLRKVLLVGTGALLSTVSPLQGESIPAIAHGVLLQGAEKEKRKKFHAAETRKR
jgi:stage V sporulation protein AD